MVLYALFYGVRGENVFGVVFGENITRLFT